MNPTPEARLPANYRSAAALRPAVPQVAIAGVLLFALGGGVGYMLGQQPSVPAQQTIVESNDWLDDVVAHYRLFARQTSHLTEMPASDPAAIIEWLLANTGVNFRIPDLTDSGLALQGARLFAAGSLPVGELMYRSDDGEVVSILFRKNHPDEDGFSELIRDDIALMSWKSATTTYVVVGPSSSASLDDIAAKAAGLI